MPEAVAARLIGSLFVERGLVSESQIRVALEIQRESGEQLGKILVEQFNVPRKELTRVVAEQWREVYGDGAGPDAGPGETWRPLGEIFLTRGFVSEEELDEALRRQRQTGERLGEALVALGVISKFELAGALGEQMATLQKAAEEEAALEARASDDNVVSLAQRMLETAASFGPDASEELPVDVDEPVTEVAPLEAVATDETFDEPDEAHEELQETQEEVVDVPPVEPESSFDEPVELELGAEPETPEQHDPVAEAEPAFEPEPFVVESVEPVASVEPVDIVERVEVVVGEPPIADWAAEADPSGLAAAVCLAYASTPRGYRLVELPVELPEVGATIELPDVGQVVVTRVGRSPLPQDRRACVYVDQPFVRAALEHA
jgi:hypothetical protein